MVLHVLAIFVEEDVLDQVSAFSVTVCISQNHRHGRREGLEVIVAEGTAVETKLGSK